jgi:hypothetical protein
MIVIPIKSPKYGEHNIFIDGEDFDKIKNHNWHLLKQKHGFYVATNIRINGKQKTMLMHRVIFNSPEGFEIDHINHNKLDNRKENLRICTRAENCRNRTKYNETFSKYKGISFDDRRISKYIVRIIVNAKCLYIGSFTNDIDAALAYNNAALKYHGEYAYLNEII